MDISESKEIDLIELFTIIWKRRKTILIYTLVGVIIGIVVAFSIPKEYQAQIKVTPETKQAGLSQLGGMAAMVGLGGAGSVQEGITSELYPEIVNSTPFLMEFVDIPVDVNGEKYSLGKYITEDIKYPWWYYIKNAPSSILSIFRSKDETKWDELNRDIFELDSKFRQFSGLLTKRIKVDIDKKDPVLKFQVKLQDPLIAAIVCDSLYYKLERYMVKYQTSKVAADLAYNQRILKEAKDEYYVADEVYAQYSDRNQGAKTESSRIRIERLRNERDLAYQIYQQTAQQVEMLKIKLQEQTPIATIIEPVQIPETPISPNKLLIIIGLAFLGGVAGVSRVVVGELIKFR